MDKLTQPIAESFAKTLSGEAPGSFQNSRNTLGVGPLHPFGIEHALDFVEEEMQRFGFVTERVYYMDGYAPNLIS